LVGLNDKLQMSVTLFHKCVKHLTLKSEDFRKVRTDSPSALGRDAQMENFVRKPICRDAQKGLSAIVLSALCGFVRLRRQGLAPPA